MSPKGFNGELASACRLSNPDLAVIKENLLGLKARNVLTTSTVAHCLVTILANRREHYTRENFRSVITAVDFLVKLDPKCLEENIHLNHATQPPPELRRGTFDSSADIESAAWTTIKNTIKPAVGESAVRKRLDSSENRLVRNHTPRKLGARTQQSLSRLVRGNTAKKRSGRRPSVRSTTYQYSVNDGQTMGRPDRFASVTSYEAEYDPNLSVSPKKNSDSVKTLKCFAFNPLYTLFESLSFDASSPLNLHINDAKKKSSHLTSSRGSVRDIQSKIDSQYEDVKDLERELVEKICIDLSRFADVNFMLSVRISAEKKTHILDQSYFESDLKMDTELCSYQPVWHRLLNHGQFDHLMDLFDLIEADVRKTMFEVKLVEDTSPEAQKQDFNLGIPERGLAVTQAVMGPVYKHEKYIVSSKTALHEICSWTRTKWNQIDQKKALDFVERLIQNGADVNAVSMRREQRSKVIRDLVRRYNNDKKLKLKKLPGKDVSFYIWQTPLSLAIRSRNEHLVRLLAKHKAKMEHGDVFYPRQTGIKFDVSSFKDMNRQSLEENGFTKAADLEVVPTVYSLNETYYKVIEFETNFIDWKYIIDNEKLFEQSFRR